MFDANLIPFSRHMNFSFFSIVHTRLLHKTNQYNAQRLDPSGSKTAILDVCMCVCVCVHACVCVYIYIYIYNYTHCKQWHRN